MKLSKEAIKEHIKEHKEAYLAGGICLALGVITGGIITRNQGPGAQVSQTVKQIAWRPNNNSPFIVNLIEKSTPSKPVLLEGTNRVFNSLSEAARETGHSLPMLSRHINGHLPDLNGDVFTLLEPAA